MYRFGLGQLLWVMGTPSEFTCPWYGNDGEFPLKLMCLVFFHMIPVSKDISLIDRRMGRRYTSICLNRRGCRCPSWVFLRKTNLTHDDDSECRWFNRWLAMHNRWWASNPEYWEWSFSIMIAVSLTLLPSRIILIYSEITSKFNAAHSECPGPMGFLYLFHQKVGSTAAS